MLAAIVWFVVGVVIGVAAEDRFDIVHRVKRWWEKRRS